MEERISYKVSKEDSLHKIAEKFKTSVQKILNENVDISSYTLKEGDVLGITTTVPAAEKKSATIDEGISLREYDLLMNMQNVWQQHVFWTRSVIISLMDNNKDLDLTVQRLLKNSADIAALYSSFYDKQIVKRITELWTEHLQIGGELFTAIKNNDADLVSKIDTRWRENADMIAEYYSTINPYYEKEEIKRMIYNHLYLTKTQAQLRHAANYGADIAEFDKIEAQALNMADMFSKGLIQKFML